MTLEQLRIFVAVAEREHVTHAAEDLHLTQSAVSAAIAALEARHDVRLFDRVGRGVVLNQAGRLFRERARAVLNEAAAAETALADLGGLKHGTLSIQASQTIARYWLPERLVAFQKAHPGIVVKVEIGNTAQAAKAVTEGAAELGLVEGEIDVPVLSSRVIDEDQLVLLVGPAHPWAGRRGLPIAELAQSAWVLRELGSGTRSAFETVLRARGLDPAELPIRLTLPANEAVLAAVQAGAGATALSASVAAAAVRAGAAALVPFELPQRPYFLLRHKERHRSKAGDAFLAIAQAFKATSPLRTSPETGARAAA
jgi:DNA-binding transcriptional LysR family regulator